MKHASTAASVFKKIKVSWRLALAKLADLGGISHGNRIQFFHEGDAAFEAIHREFIGALKSIIVETYILSSDRIGLWLRDTLIDATKRGVKVVVIYDHFGSSGLTQSFLKPMMDVGIKVCGFNPIWPWRRRGPLLFRDHRKIIVVDERVAFCGGMNLNADYAGPKLGNDRFRDTLARIEGPAVFDLHRITSESLVESEFSQSNEDLSAIYGNHKSNISLRRLFKIMLKKPTLDSQIHDPQDSLVQVLRSNTRRDLTHIQKSMQLSLQRAVSYCYFTTPYFLPYDDLMNAMIDAKRRGVDVRILTAGLSDVPLMRYASRHVYQRFLDERIRIYEMYKKTLHAKLSSIDGVYSSIGSYNLDHWSARRNLEVTLSMLDRDISLQLRHQFENDLALCVEVDAHKYGSRSIFEKILGWLAYQLFRI